MSKGERDSFVSLIIGGVEKLELCSSVPGGFCFIISTGPVFLAGLCSHLIRHKPDFFN